MKKGFKTEKQEFSAEERAFVSYLNGGDYPYKNEGFKFIIVCCDCGKNVLRSFFSGFLDNLIIIRYHFYYLMIHGNKEKTEIGKYAGSLSEDIGEKMGIFEGFEVGKELGDEFIAFLALYEKYFASVRLTYASVADLIRIALPEEIKQIKELVFTKVMKDKETLAMIKALFRNNLNVSRTAREIYMHRNTINNRIDQLENETSLCIREFKDAVAVFELLKDRT